MCGTGSERPGSRPPTHPDPSSAEFDGVEAPLSEPRLVQKAPRRSVSGCTRTSAFRSRLLRVAIDCAEGLCGSNGPTTLKVARGSIPTIQIPRCARDLSWDSQFFAVFAAAVNALGMTARFIIPTTVLITKHQCQWRTITPCMCTLTFSSPRWAKPKHGCEFADLTSPRLPKDFGRFRQ